MILPVSVLFAARISSVTENCTFLSFRSHMNPRNLQGPPSGPLSVTCAQNIRVRLSNGNFSRLEDCLEADYLDQTLRGEARGLQYQRAYL